jgi:hypothetical protein
MRRRVSGFTLLIGAIVAFAMQARALAAPNIVFEDDRPLTLAWDEALAGTEVLICNVGDATAEGLSVRATGFVFRSGDELPDPTEVLDVTLPERLQASGKLKADKCRALGLRIVRADLNPGSYPGLLIVRTKGLGPAKREITVAGPKMRLTTDAVTLEAVHTDSPLEDQPLDLELPLVRDGQTAASQPPFGTILSVTTQGDRLVELVVDESPSPGPSLEVKVLGAEPGTLTFKSGLIEGTVTVNIHDSIWWAIAAVGTGLVAGLGLLLWTQHGNARLALWWKSRRLEKKYNKAHKRLKKEYPSFEEYAFPSENITRYVARSNAALRNYRKGNLFFDPNSDDFKKIVKELTDAEQDAYYFGSKEGFGSSLKKLEKALADFTKQLNSDLGNDREPALAQKAKALLIGGPLDVGGATKRGAEADEATTLIEEWRALATGIKRLVVWVLTLRTCATDAEDLIVIQEAEHSVREATNELLDAKDMKGLDALKTRSDIEKAYQQLARLGSKYNVWVTPVGEVIGKRARAERLFLFKEAAVPATALDKTDEISTEARFQEIEGFVVDVLGRGAGSLVNFSVVVITIAAAIGTALTTVYYGKNFGAPQDYLAAFLIGLGSPVVVKGIGDTISRVRNPLKT